MAIARRFMKEDWYGLAGCTRFADGSEPFIAELDFANIHNLLLEATVVGDAEAIQVHVYDSREDEAEFWHLSHNLPPFAVEAIVNRVAQECRTRESLAAAGFVRQ